MKMRWDVDDANSVVLNIGMIRTRVLVNGKDVPAKISMRKKNYFPFDLADGRDAVITVTPHFGMRPDITLMVNDELMVETGGKPILCSACGKPVKPNDRFCGACGHEMPPAEHHLHNKHVKSAMHAIIVLAVLFAVAGVFLYSVTNDKADLVVYLILSGIMAGLAWWSRRAPLAAVLVATATYIALIVVNAILDPKTLGQGLLVKIIIIALLVRGIKAALALRSANE